MECYYGMKCVWIGVNNRGGSQSHFEHRWELSLGAFSVCGCMVALEGLG